jgi:predicted amidohydrolase YtcJ
MPTRRDLIGVASTLALNSLLGTHAIARSQGDSPMPSTSNTTPDVVFYNGRITTLDRTRPQASAVAIKDGRFVAVGTDAEVMALAGSTARRIDLKGRGVLPGLFDNHTHVVRGGLNYNMELRWDGVRSLADAMGMLKRQVAITPAPQWVRIVGGFTEHQFAEKRLPTIEEINAIAPDTPVFILHLYDRALLNGAALRAVRPAARSSATARATPPGCCWPSPTRPSCTPRWPRAPSCRLITSSIPRAISCAN